MRFWSCGSDMILSFSWSKDVKLFHYTMAVSPRGPSLHLEPLHWPAPAEGSFYGNLRKRLNLDWCHLSNLAKYKTHSNPNSSPEGPANAGKRLINSSDEGLAKVSTSISFKCSVKCLWLCWLLKHGSMIFGLLVMLFSSLIACGLLLKGNGWEQNIMQSGDDQSRGLMVLLIQSCQETQCVCV